MLNERTETTIAQVVEDTLSSASKDVFWRMRLCNDETENSIVKRSNGGHLWDVHVHRKFSVESSDVNCTQTRLA